MKKELRCKIREGEKEEANEKRKGWKRERKREGKVSGGRNN